MAVYENGGLGIYKPGFPYKKESLDFFRQCVGEKAYHTAMSSDTGHNRPYVFAKLWLSENDWNKFVWIEEHGSLDGFPD